MVCTISKTHGSRSTRNEGNSGSENNLLLYWSVGSYKVDALRYIRCYSTSSTIAWPIGLPCRHRPRNAGEPRTSFSPATEDSSSHPKQNYTCTSPKNATATPTALGAIATLYNVSCQASISANTLAYVADTVAKISLDSFGPVLFPASPSSLISGYHYFADATTPTFNLNVDSTNLGVIFSEKKANVTAPTYAGTGADGSKAVPWLKLTAKKPPGTDSDIDPENVGGVQEVYRVNTAGGAAPATCAGIEGTTFTRQYSAEYWFWAR